MLFRMYEGCEGKGVEEERGGGGCIGSEWFFSLQKKKELDSVEFLMITRMKGGNEKKQTYHSR